MPAHRMNAEPQEGEERTMADSYDRYDSEGGGGGFMMGLLTGTVLGAGLGMLLAPKAGAAKKGAPASKGSGVKPGEYRPG